VGDRLWKKGVVYDLPDSLLKDEKNFIAIEGEVKEPIGDKGLDAWMSPDDPVKCDVCGKECKNYAGLKTHKMVHIKRN
jgi:hypothetical protein